VGFLFSLLNIWNLFSRTTGFFYDIFAIFRNLAYIFSVLFK